MQAVVICIGKVSCFYAAGFTAVLRPSPAPSAPQADPAQLSGYRAWAFWNQIQIDFSRPGKPTDNAYCGSFNGTVRKEFLNASWFENLESVCRAAREWRKYYNAERLHRSLGHKTPEEFALTAKSQLASGEKVILQCCFCKAEDASTIE